MSVHASNGRVAIVASTEYHERISYLPVHGDRVSTFEAVGLNFALTDSLENSSLTSERMLWTLIEACGLSSQLRILKPRLASSKDMVSYHSREYVSALEHADELDEETCAEFGLVDDCAIFRGLWEYCRALIGGVLAAAAALSQGNVTIAMCWAGGRHHAQKESASGFCFVNDAVLAILFMQKQRFRRILYIDIDIHHGDGVADAFYCSEEVFTMSIHKLARGFFPGTGSRKELGLGNGKYRNLNVPLHDGADDEVFGTVFRYAVDRVVSIHKPDAIVFQCGADALGSDPLGTFNLTGAGVAQAVSHVVEKGLPVLILGGGGYNKPDTVKAWARATAAASRQLSQLPCSIPDHEFFPLYGPNFSMQTRRGRRENKNTPEYTKSLLSWIQKILARLESA